MENVFGTTIATVIWVEAFIERHQRGNVMTKYCFVTGLLASKALHKTLNGMDMKEEYQVKTLHCKVAALMNTDFIARHLTEPIDAETIVIPGLSRGETRVITEKTGMQVIKGPKDVRELPYFFGKGTCTEATTVSNMKILGEIVEAPAMTVEQILQRARYYKKYGADYIDLGTHLDDSFYHLEETVKALKQEGFLVSIDSFNPEEILTAVRAGADMVLSLNSNNLYLAEKLDCKIVVVPDHEYHLDKLYKTVDHLLNMGKDIIIDPVFPPLTYGLGEAIARYVKVRHDYPQVPMCMGIANVTELVDADSAGVNAVLTGIASELEVNYILTTEYSVRARGSVHEISLARNLVHQAKERLQFPKHIDDRLMTLKDPVLNYYQEEELREMHQELTDRNYRIFVDGTAIYVFNAHEFLKGKDPQQLFNSLDIADPTHAFYLGRELERAATALQLGKNYIQESLLDWGYFNDFDDALKSEKEMMANQESGD